MTDVNDRQVGGNHYKQHKVQPWDIVNEYGLNFFEGTMLKYLLRRKHSALGVDHKRVEDLNKLIHTAEKEIENIVNKHMGVEPGIQLATDDELRLRVEIAGEVDDA